MITRQTLISVLLVGGLVNSAIAQIEVPPPPVLEEVQRVTHSVHRVVIALIEVMDDTSVPEGYRQRAINALGLLRHDEAIMPLFDQLLFKAGAIGAPGPLTYFPAAQALSGYGRDLYQSLPAVLSEERSPEYVYVLACLLHTVDGKRIALIRIEKEQAAERLTDTQRQNFTRLINRFKTTNYDDVLNWPRLKLKQQARDDTSELR